MHSHFEENYQKNLEKQKKNLFTHIFGVISPFFAAFGTKFEKL
jgi:hypothetical protein